MFCNNVVRNLTFVSDYLFDNPYLGDGGWFGLVGAVRSDILVDSLGRG